MKVPTLHSLKWIQISSFIQAHIMPWTHDAIVLLKTHSWQISQEKNSIKKLSLFHINVKSLPKHHDELELYINSLKFEFSVIDVTENWLDESKQDLFDLQGYNCLHTFRQGKRGDGVSLYIQNGIDFLNGLHLSILTVKWSHYLLKLMGVALIYLQISS